MLRTNYKDGDILYASDLNAIADVLYEFYKKYDNTGYIRAFTWNSDGDHLFASTLKNLSEDLRHYYKVKYGTTDGFVSPVPYRTQYEDTICAADINKINEWINQTLSDGSDSEPETPTNPDTGSTEGGGEVYPTSPSVWFYTVSRYQADAHVEFGNGKAFICAYNNGDSNFVSKWQSAYNVTPINSSNSDKIYQMSDDDWRYTSNFILFDNNNADEISDSEDDVAIDIYVLDSNGDIVEFCEYDTGTLYIGSAWQDGDTIDEESAINMKYSKRNVSNMLDNGQSVVFVIRDYNEPLSKENQKPLGLATPEERLTWLKSLKIFT